MQVKAHQTGNSTIQHLNSFNFKLLQLNLPSNLQTPRCKWTQLQQRSHCSSNATTLVASPLGKTWRTQPLHGSESQLEYLSKILKEEIAQDSREKKRCLPQGTLAPIYSQIHLQTTASHLDTVPPTFSKKTSEVIV
jgi:hypothetical protein